jgi:enolase-phosphatase E1
VTGALLGPDIRTVLLDIEGTTTPIAFVRDVLFPFARTHLAAWCRGHARSGSAATVVARLKAEHALDRARDAAVPPWPGEASSACDDGCQAYVHWLMDRDRKSPALKTLQGLIWEEGYQSGALRGEVYADVAPAIAGWHQRGIATAIYSSGSELAQRRLFASTESGDLTPMISGFFDTAVGSKQEPASYARIASRLGCAVGAMLFLSDVVPELRAAGRAGCHVALVVRPGNAPQTDRPSFRVVHTLEEVR